MKEVRLYAAALAALVGAVLVGALWAFHDLRAERVALSTQQQVYP